MKTPVLPNDIDYTRVYEPAEDTFLFLDALESESDYLKNIQPRVCMEIGCGSGMVITFLSQLMHTLRHHCVYFATDINPYAASTASKTANYNNSLVDIVLTPFTAAFNPTRFNRSVDVLLFNPPYVVTPPEELNRNTIETSWAGGKDGRQVIDAFLPSVNNLLSQEGVFYLVVVNENKPEEMMDMMRREYGFEAQRIMYRKAGMEGLSILKFNRKRECVAMS